MHIAIRCVPSVLAPFTRENAATGRFLRHGWYGIANEWESLSFVEEGAATSAGREELICERRVYDANQRFGLVDEGDANTEHGEEVDIVYGSIERVDTPCWRVVD